MEYKIKLREMGNSHPVLGENINEEKEDNHRVQDWTFSIIKLQCTFVGTGLVMVLGLHLLYNVIPMSGWET